MSRDISRLVPLSRLNRVLQDLESDGDGIDPVHGITKGPFSAFQLPISPSSFGTEWDSSPSVQRLPESDQHEMSLVVGNHPRIDHDSDQLLQEIGVSYDLDSGLDEWNGIMDVVLGGTLPTNDLSFPWNLPPGHDQSPFIPSPVPLNLPLVQGGDNLATVPENANFLLSHYKEQMGRLFSPIRVKKPPWAVLHLPCATATVSELTIWGKASHAKISLLRAILAVSAFNLDRIHYGLPEQSTFWWNVGDKNREIAKREVQLCLSTEIEGPEKSKYKEILMALLSMVTISVRLIFQLSRIQIHAHGSLKRLRVASFKMRGSSYSMLKSSSASEGLRKPSSRGK